MFKTYIRVFVSYSRKDNPLLIALKSVLENGDEIHVRIDTQDISAGEGVHKKIGNIIDWSDIVIPIITENWLKSHETRDELIRAHERRKHIIPLVDDLVFNNTLVCLPHYLIDGNQIRFNNNTLVDCLEKLKKSVITYKSNKWKQKIYHDLGTIGRYVFEKNDSMLYQNEYTKSLIKSTKVELKSVLSGNSFEIEIGLEKNFLNRVLPIFHKADKIYAISIADISSFWISKEDEALTIKFIESQGNKEVYRLFVFSNPEQVVKYKNVLQANFEAYGRGKGGVFICSYKAYIKFIESIVSHNVFLRDIHQEDFAIFVFKSDCIVGHDEHVEGILDSNALKFRSFSLNEIKSSSRIQFMRAMENLGTIECGKYSTDYNIYRWCYELYDKEFVFEEVLSRLFDEEHEQILHYLFIRGDDSVGIVLQELCRKFRNSRKDLRISDVNVYDVTGVNAIDGNFGGLIKTGFDDAEQYNYMLIVEFEDIRALEHYYNHKTHSVEREILYKAINPDVENLYCQANAMLKYKDSSYNRLRELYNEIEESMKKYIFRIDVKKSISFSYLTRLKGVSIGRYIK